MTVLNFLRGDFSTYLRLYDNLKRIRIVKVPARLKMQYAKREYAWSYAKIKTRKQWNLIVIEPSPEK